MPWNNGGERPHFLFIGSGAKKDWLEREVRRHELSNVTILPPQPAEILAISLNACDLAVISFVPGMAGISVPSRMYNILAAGKPIVAVADDDSELAKVVHEERVGWVVLPHQSECLLSVLKEAAANPKTLHEMGAKARAVAENKYSFQHSTELYRSLIDTLSGGVASAL